MITQTHGYVAIENNNIVGLMSFYNPTENFFSTFPGVYGPMHGNAATKENKDKIYARLYQYAAGELVAKGITTHSIGIFAHNEKVLQKLFYMDLGTGV